MAKLLSNVNLINKYVWYTDIYKQDNLVLTPKSHIFIVFDKDSDPDTRYIWCIKSIIFNKLELWVKQTQLIVLPPQEQESVRLIYG